MTQTISTRETLDSFAERSAKDWEMKARLSTFLNSMLNVEVLTGSEIQEVKEIAEYFKLEFTLEKISKIKV